MQIDVTLTTLDEASERLDMGDVAFVKLDAEGEERAIVDGGRSFLQRTEPLVMYEVRHGAQVRTDLVAHFETLGFQTYRLVAGLGALVPFDLKSAVDPVPLNLFSCSPATAARLSERDLLVRELPAGLVMPPGTNPVLHAVERYRWAVEGKGPLAIRAVELKGAFERLRDHATENPVVHLALARVARAWGERGAAVNALRTASDALSRGAPLDPVELCTNGPLLLAPLERLEGKRPGEMDERQWARAMAIAALEETAGYSSFFAPLKSRERLALLNDLGFEDAQLARRRALVDELCELVSVVNA